MAKAGPSPESIFLLCEVGKQGFPIQYASPGFTELYGYGQAECIGKNCGTLVGGESIKADEQALAQVAKAAGLAHEEAIGALDTLTARAGEQCRAMFGDGRFGFTLALNRKKNGAIFTCELLTVLLQRADLGWSFAIGMQRDVSRAVPPGELLAAAACGGLQELVEESQVGIASRLAQLGISSGGVAQHVHDNAVARAQAMRPSAGGRRRPAGQGPEGAAGGRADSKASEANSASKAPGISAAPRLANIPEGCAEESCSTDGSGSCGRSSSSASTPSASSSTHSPSDGRQPLYANNMAGVQLSPGEPAYIKQPCLLGRRRLDWSGEQKAPR